MVHAEAGALRLQAVGDNEEVNCANRQRCFHLHCVGAILPLARGMTGFGTFDEDEYDDDFEDLNEAGDIGNNGIAGDNLFNSNSVHGIIERFLETAGLAGFADAIMFDLGKDFTCLNDLFNPDNLRGEELMGDVVGMNQEQVQSCTPLSLHTLCTCQT